MHWPWIAQLPSRAERRLIRLAIYVFLAIMLGAAAAVYWAFPRRRRLLCKLFLVAGFALVAPLLGYIWTGHAEDMGDAVRPLVLAAAGTGFLLVIAGALLLYLINKHGDAAERL